MNNGSYPKKIGILGGTFNPIHVGHLILAESAMDYCGLDKVLIMPSGCSYLKDQETIADKIHRVNMAKLAIEGNDRFELSTIEVDREGNSYTFETLDMLCRQDPDARYYFIIGADILFTIEKWNRPEDIFNKCTIVCAQRDGIDSKDLEKKASELKSLFNADVIIMDVPEMKVSSSNIRDYLKRGWSCKYYLDEKVREYIINNSIY